MAVNQDELLIKLGMKRKKKWSLGGQTKRTNWKSVSCILNGFDHKLMNQWQGDLDFSWKSVRNLRNRISCLLLLFSASLDSACVNTMYVGLVYLIVDATYF